ncbi:zinc finger protein 91-like [Condylostylus longicornis]|uniref:zinc finger protein 91-like n=1 Tax=Condylostylus longicornis TaxID=2530218 RepID=UPI00244DFDEA|nr:zinc finger protein 91-like [Condylostylus longicornis]
MGSSMFINEHCSIEEICRTCTMHYDSCSMIPIFKNNSKVEIKAHQIMKFFFDLLQLELTENDSLPQNICEQCYSKFVNFKIFLDECIEAHNTLIAAVEKSKSIAETLIQEKSKNSENEIYALEKENDREIEFLEETLDNHQVSTCNTDSIKHMKQGSEIACVVKDHNYQDIGLDIIEEDSNVEMLVEYENYNDMRTDYISESELHVVDNENVALLDCSYCNFAFPEEYFAQHMNDYHPTESPFLCTKCFRNFRTQSIRDKHVLLNMCQINEIKLQDFQNIAVEIFVADDDDYDPKVFNETECLEQTEIQNETLYEKNDLLFSNETDAICIENAKDSESNSKKDLSLRCPVCEEQFTKSKFFSDHLKRSHPDFDRKAIRSKYSCEVCDKDCKSKQSLESHLNSHKGIKPYACEICKTSFFGSKALRTHISNEHSSLQFNCEICGKDFNKKSIFLSHMSNHKKDNDPNRKPDIKYKCQFCPRTFNTVSTLTIHSLTHKKLLDSKHICNVCGVTFKRADHLKMHMYGVHLDHKPFPCEQCEKSFPTAWQRNTHVKKYHSAEKKKYKCQVCPNEYASSNALKRHNMIHTGELKYNCDICELKFPKIFLLEEHLKTHEIDENLRQESINEVYMEIAKSVIIPN